MLVCAPILKINKIVISNSLSPWNYFYKTMVLILRQFLNIKTMVLYSGGSINRESLVGVPVYSANKKCQKNLISRISKIHVFRHDTICNCNLGIQF